MKKKILIGSIIAVALLTLVSFSSVVGKVSLEPVPDLDCEGSLDWIEVEPGDIVTGDFTVENIGEPDSLLNWEIEQMDNNNEIITRISDYIGLDYYSSEGILLQKVEFWTYGDPFCYLEIIGYKRPLFPLYDSKFNASPKHIIADRFFGLILQMDEHYVTIGGYAIGNIEWE